MAESDREVMETARLMKEPIVATGMPDGRRIA